MGNLLRYGLAGAAVVVPINFVLFALENVLFLLFPARQMAATPGDFHALGRQFLTLFARTLVLAPTIAVVGVAGMGAVPRRAAGASSSRRAPHGSSWRPPGPR